MSAEYVFAQFSQAWAVHFSKSIHPIVKLLAEHAVWICSEPHEPQLRWEFADGRLSIGLAFELQDAKWNIHLPPGVSAFLNPENRGETSPLTSLFARELVNNNPYCVVKIVFAPFVNDGVLIGFFFGGKLHHAEE